MLRRLVMGSRRKSLAAKRKKCGNKHQSHVESRSSCICVPLGLGFDTVALWKRSMYTDRTCMWDISSDGSLYAARRGTIPTTILVWWMFARKIAGIAILSLIGLPMIDILSCLSFWTTPYLINKALRWCCLLCVYIYIRRNRINLHKQCPSKGS